MAPTTTSPPLSNVINTYCTLAIIGDNDPKNAETVVRNHVLNLQRVGTVDTDAYASVAVLFKDVGCPLAFYETVALPFDNNTAVATATLKKSKKRSFKCFDARYDRVCE